MRRTLLRSVAGLAVAATALSGCGGGHVAPPSPSLGTAVDIAVPPAIAHLPLTTSTGATTDLAAFHGKAVMIADFLSLCTDICPMISANTAALGRALAADGQGNTVALLEISVDPQRDTPARLRAYRKLYGPALPDWTLLRATPADTAKLWKFFDVAYKRIKEPRPPAIDWLTHKPLTYDVEHTSALIFLDAAGRERFVVEAAPDARNTTTPAKLVRFLGADGHEALRHPDPVDSWTVAQGLSVFSWLIDRHLTSP
jgi:protein SCO1/2